MPVKVYYWSSGPTPIGHSYFGHVALEVEGASGSRYLSWYPKGDFHLDAFIDALPQNKSKAQDDKDRGPVTEIVTILGLMEEEIVRYIDRERTSYSLFGTSCTQVVIESLRYGTGAVKTKTGRVGMRIGILREDSARAALLSDELVSYWTPDDVVKIARRIRDCPIP